MPTSQPDDLKCILTTDKSLEFSWKLPRKGMTNSIGTVDVNYHFSYWIEEKTGGMYIPKYFRVIKKLRILDFRDWYL